MFNFFNQNKRFKEELENQFERFHLLQVENVELRQKIEELSNKLEKAEDLKAILLSFKEQQDNFIVSAGSGITLFDLHSSIQSEINTWALDKNVAVYVDDLFGGKVIKQEAHKAILIKANGTVLEGLTKEPKTKVFSYTLD